MKNTATTPKILFDDSSIPFILKAFGKEVNEEGIIIESSTGEPVLTPDDEEVEAYRLGGIKKGSEIYLKDDLSSIIKLTEGEYK